MPDTPAAYARRAEELQRLGIRLDDEVVGRHLREEHGFLPQAQ